MNIYLYISKVDFSIYFNYDTKVEPNILSSGGGNSIKFTNKEKELEGKTIESRVNRLSNSIKNWNIFEF